MPFVALLQRASYSMAGLSVPPHKTSVVVPKAFSCKIDENVFKAWVCKVQVAQFNICFSHDLRCLHGQRSRVLNRGETAWCRACHPLLLAPRSRPPSLLLGAPARPRVAMSWSARLALRSQLKQVPVCARAIPGWYRRESISSVLQGCRAQEFSHNP